MAVQPHFRLFLISASLLSVGGCGSGDFSTGFEDAARKQGDLDNKTLSLFLRSPIVDANDTSLNATSDLSGVPRSSLSFAGITDIHSALKSPQFRVYQSTTKLSAPVFYDYAGTDISTDDPAFQSFMGWAHAEKARKYAQSVLTDIDFESDAHPVLPLTIYALEEGSVTSTNYDPSTAAIYLYHDSEGARPKYRVADESDSITHEFGHAIQDTLNEPILQTSVAGFLDVAPANRDLDGILEGLADFNAAAVAGDPYILSWLSKNLPAFLAGSGTRTGESSYQRSTTNSLSLNGSYVRQAHLDGRIVSGLMNDIRKLLNAQGASSGTAFARAYQLAFRAYETMGTTVTYFDYAARLLDRCDNDSDIAAWCSSTIRTGIVSLLETRGYKLTADDEAGSDATTYKVTGGAALTVGAGTVTTGTAELTFDAGIGWMPFPNDTGFANADADVDPCEVLLVYPSFTVGASADSFYDFTVSLSAATVGFTNLIAGGDTIEQVATYTSAPRKALPWINASETTDGLIDFVNNPTTTLYNAKGGAYFTQKLSSTYYPSDVGWLVRAPSSGNASLTFSITARRKTARSTESYMRVNTVRQTLSVTGDGDFCD